MRIRIAILAILLFLAGQTAHAVITAKTPLSAIEGSTSYVLFGKVEKHFPEKPAMIVSIVEDIKGKAPFRSMPINLLVEDKDTFEKNKIGPLLKRFGPDAEIVFFLTKKGKNLITFAYTNGTWFQMHGSIVAKDQVVFRLLSAEPYFRKSFNGSTADLRKLLKDHAAGKATLPTAVDDKIEAGFGPEYTPTKSSRLPSNQGDFAIAGGGDGPLFAVIPTIGLGAPLAILAILFPSVFGGVFVLFRQWMAFITLLSVNSTVLMLHVLCAGYLPRGNWWATPGAAWIVMSLACFACAFWAWRRQLSAMGDGEAEAPARTELSVLGFMCVGFIATTVAMGFLETNLNWSNIGWTLTVLMTLAILLGTLHRTWHAIRVPGPFASPPISTEGVIVAAMLFGHVAFAPAFFSGSIDATGAASGKGQAGEVTGKVVPVTQKWVYTTAPNVLGMFASSPVIHGDQIYAAYCDSTQRSTMVCLDRNTGLQKWEFFGENADLRQMISTPCFADGKLYFGEGFHDDQNCHLFCVDAKDGEETWRFKTKGQTESSPCVDKDKVYIGAGNDGVYCVDIKKSHAAKKGVVHWRFPPKDYAGRLLRFGGGMLVVGDRLYCGAAVDRNQKGDKGETATFCLDANTGEEIWRTAAPYPVWSTPIFRDGKLYVTSGNGDVYTDPPPPEVPGGAVQCLDAKTGKEVWMTKIGSGIIDSPVVDGHRIYFGCRDQHAYCLGRIDGKQRWKFFLQSPIIGTPVVDCDPVLERSLSVFFLTTGGKVCCMDPKSGDLNWEFDLADKQAVTSTSLRLVVNRTAEGYRRRLYFGAGIGGGQHNIYAGRPAFYCLEDKVNVE